MKTIMLLVLLHASLYGFAQKNKKTTLSADTMRSTSVPGVPDKLMEKFSIAYPGASDVKWSKEESEGYRVIFRDPSNTQQLIIYDQNWKVRRKETELDSKQVPDTITNYYKQNYPQEKGYRVWLNEDASGRTYYANGMEFGIFFDMKGNVIRRVPVQGAK